MEAKSKENTCSCKEKKPISCFCKKCNVYLCGDCEITKHIDHESEIENLAEKCTWHLAELQKLSRSINLISDRRQVHIKDESIEGIVAEIKNKIMKATNTLQGDISKTTDTTIQYILHSPLVQDFIKKKEVLAGAGDPLGKLKAELNSICRELLRNITDNKFESADKMLSEEKLNSYKEETKKQTGASDTDLQFIQELQKLKHTTVEYSYNPMSILGMIKIDSKIKKPNRLVQFDREKMAFNIFNMDINKLVSTVISPGFILPFRFVAIEVGNNIYLSGGDNDHGQYLKSLYIYEELRGTLIGLANMQESRSRHAAVAIENKEIYVVGGESAKGLLNSCEIYDIQENLWKQGPSMNESRCGLSACYIDNSIFAVGGWNEDYLATIEKLKLVADPKWEIIKLSKKHNLKPLQYPGLIPIKEHVMLVFGGYKEGEELSKECYLLDVKSESAAKGAEMIEGDGFISSEIKRVENSLICFGYSKGGIHTFDIANSEWKFTPQENIPK